MAATRTLPPPASEVKGTAPAESEPLPRSVPPALCLAAAPTTPPARCSHPPRSLNLTERLCRRQAITQTLTQYEYTIDMYPQKGGCSPSLRSIYRRSQVGETETHPRDGAWGGASTDATVAASFLQLAKRAFDGGELILQLAQRLVVGRARVRRHGPASRSGVEWSPPPTKDHPKHQRAHH
jgi:hypothetical protein